MSSDTAAASIPPNASLPELREIAAGCTACPLYQDATQVVFGEGPPNATWMVVGEIPGDQEDKQGHPFVGPAGRLLDACLEEAGLDRSEGYLTNAVKHFKFKKATGKRRLHDTPRWSEVVACRPWVEQEIALVRPKVLLCLGATATKSLLGPKVKVTQIRGQLVESDLAPFVTATVHPSSLLRLKENRAEERARFVADLVAVRQLIDR